jgi:TolB-like protein
MAVAALALILILPIFYVLARGQAQQVPRPAREASATRSGLPLYFPGAGNAKSIAVLPFDNFSGDSKEEYFSDGMTEEITSALAKIQNLAVVGRTSAFQFKGKAADLRAIGKSLNATYLLEGSVRKANARIRVTAQLIRADTGDHLWTESYDRDLKDVFAVQEDIARAIAAALQVPLGLKEGENLVSNRTSDTAAYEDYLRAIALAYNNGDTNQSIVILESAVRRDPGYAPAWAFLATVYPYADDLADKGEPTKGSSSSQDELRTHYRSALAKTEMAARNALRLDPNSALAYAALGNLENLRTHWAAADDDFVKALTLDPTDPLILNKYGSLLETEGRLRQALKVHTRMQQAEPSVSNYNYTAGTTMLLSGDANRAVTMLEQVQAAFGQVRDFRSLLGFAYASIGQYQRAAQIIRSISPDRVLYPAADIRAAADIVGTAPAQSASASLSYLSPLVWVYLFVGEPQRFMDAQEYQGTAVNLAFPWIQDIWHPAMAGARKTQRFKQLVRKWGLADYWRTRGWPDMCRPIGADDFECS